MITNTRALENVEGVKFVEISLNREVLVSTHLRHSLIREEIMKKMEKIEWLNPASIEVPNKEKLALRVLIDRVTNFVSQQIVHYP